MGKKDTPENEMGLLMEAAESKALEAVIGMYGEKKKEYLQVEIWTLPDEDSKGKMLDSERVKKKEKAEVAATRLHARMASQGMT